MFCICMCTSGAMYGGVPQQRVSFRSLPLCLKTVDKPKSDIFTTSRQKQEHIIVKITKVVLWASNVHQCVHQALESVYCV